MKVGDLVMLRVDIIGRDTRTKGVIIDIDEDDDPDCFVDKVEVSRTQLSFSHRGHFGILKTTYSLQRRSKMDRDFMADIGIVVSIVSVFFVITIFMC